VIALFGQAIKDDRDLSKYGSVEYDKNDPDRLDSRRVTISQRYDNDHWVYSRVHPETGGVGRIKEEPPPPLIPVDESACIVIGRVGKVEAFLSNDKHGVYSEFTINIDEVLKKDGLKKARGYVVADREGGVVVYPGGQRVRYANSDQDIPVRGTQYLFFLTTDSVSPNYRILTSYELTTNGFRQMEMGQSLGEFKDANKDTFLKAIRRRLAPLSN